MTIATALEGIGTVCRATADAVRDLVEKPAPAPWTVTLVHDGRGVKLGQLALAECPEAGTHLEFEGQEYVVFTVMVKTKPLTATIRVNPIEAFHSGPHAAAPADEHLFGAPHSPPSASTDLPPIEPGPHGQPPRCSLCHREPHLCRCVAEAPSCDHPKGFVQHRDAKPPWCPDCGLLEPKFGS